MLTMTDAPAMQQWADRARRAGRRIGLVPTMGYLHEGHLGLVREARRCSDCCVTSIFVNPLQFGRSEDLARYPQNITGDTAQLEEAEVDVLYLPGLESMYPDGFQTEVSVCRVTQGLCGRSRPGHFDGVTTVVAKLFNAVKPHVAVFGEKDFQQLVTIRRMVVDLDYDIEIIGMPIVREADGVAMSSRNAYLSKAERDAARCLPRALETATRMVDGGEHRPALVLEQVRDVFDAEPLARVDYAELVDTTSIEQAETIDRPTLLALAVYVGNTRLIDNRVLGSARRIG